MNERFTMTHAYIIDKAEIDSEGNFQFNTAYLPKEEALYRIHVVKKEDPAASLIIGGRDENFHLLIASSKDSIFLDGTEGFSKAKLLGSSANFRMQEIKQWVSYGDSSTFDGSPVKRELIVNAIDEKLRQLADTNRQALVALYALYCSDFETHRKNNPLYYSDFLEKWKNEDSEYYALFRSQVGSSARFNSFFWISIILIIAALFVGVEFGKRRAKGPELVGGTELLSVQQLKIYKLLQEGKTNKEISEEYNIGVNTVKSHVSSILNKLKLKSRREAMDDV